MTSTDVVPEIVMRSKIDYVTFTWKAVCKDYKAGEW